MTDDTLQTFIARARADWGPLTTALTRDLRRHAQALLAAPGEEPWLAALHRTRPARQELYRDPDHGFVLLAHAEHAGLYRPPHDHGRAWVLYGVQQGAVEMRTFTRLEGADGGVRLVQRDSTTVTAGGVQIYLPGDIHDTRCLSDTALLFRFTERDLAVEDGVEHRVTRYAAPEDSCAAAAR